MFHGCQVWWIPIHIWVEPVAQYLRSNHQTLFHLCWNDSVKMHLRSNLLLPIYQWYKWHVNEMVVFIIIFVMDFVPVYSNDSCLWVVHLTTCWSNKEWWYSKENDMYQVYSQTEEISWMSEKAAAGYNTLTLCDQRLDS